MSTGVHLNKEIHDLIRNIGEARSKQEEDEIIKKDIEILKKKTGPKSKITNGKKLRELLIRCIYADMLGHNVDFCHFFAVNMCQNKNLSVKRAGYLTCMLLLREESQFRMMLVATLQKDLLSTSTYNVLIGLNTLCKLISNDNLSSFSEIVIKLLGNANPLIKKKAFCVFGRMLKLSRDTLTNYDLKLKDALGDRDASVMGVSLNIYYNEALRNPAKYKDIIRLLVSTHNKILNTKLARDYDFARIPAPWMQLKLLQLYGVLGKNDKSVSEEVYNVVEKALRRADDTLVSIGYAITYQCVLTICDLYPNSTLLEKASKTIGKFFIHDVRGKINSHNLRYLGIEAMRSMVRINPKYASLHQLHIVECLEHPDESVRRLTLDLLYKTTNSANLEFIVKRMIAFLKSTNDERFRNDLVLKIYELNEKLAPNPEWFIMRTNELLEFGNDCVNDEMLSRTIKLLDENLDNDYDNEFCQLLLNSYYEYLSRPLPDQLVKLIAWILGEIAHRFYYNDSSSLKQLSDAICSLFEQQVKDESTKVWVINSLSKLVSCDDFGGNPAVDEALGECLNSKNVELRQRAFEYRKNPNGVTSLLKVEDFDEELSFLQPQIEKAIRMGLGKYDRSKANTLLKKMKKREQEEKKNKFKTIHHKVDISELKKTKNQIGKITEGKGGKKDSNWNTNNKDWVKKPPTEDQKKENEGSKAKEVKPFEIKKKKNDPKTQQRARTAKVLFQDTGSAKLKRPKRNKVVFKKPKIGDKKKKPGKNPFSAPKVVKKAATPNTEMNLLEDTQDGNIDLLNDSPISPQKKGFGFQKPKPRQNIFSQPKAVQKTQEPETPSLEPLQLEQGDFEQKWPSLEEEVFDENIPTKKVKTQKSFEEMTKTLGFHIVNAISNDNICAAKYGEHVVLMYGQYKLAGGLECRVRTVNDELSAFILDMIKEYCRKN